MTTRLGMLLIITVSLILCGCGKTSKAVQEEPKLTAANTFTESPSGRYFAMFTHNKFDDARDDHVEVVDRYTHKHQDILLHGCRDTNDEARLVSITWDKNEKVFVLVYAIYPNFYHWVNSSESNDNSITNTEQKPYNQSLRFNLDPSFGWATDL